MCSGRPDSNRRPSAMEPFVKEHARWYVSNCISLASYTEIQDMNREINNVNWLWFDDGLIERLIKNHEDWNSNYPKFWNDYN